MSISFGGNSCSTLHRRVRRPTLPRTTRLHLRPWHSFLGILRLLQQPALVNSTSIFIGGASSGPRHHLPAARTGRSPATGFHTLRCKISPKSTRFLTGQKAKSYETESIHTDQKFTQRAGRAHNAALETPHDNKRTTRRTQVPCKLNETLV